MTQRAAGKRLRRALLDAAIGFAAFALMSIIAFGGDSHAGPTGIFTRPFNMALETAMGALQPQPVAAQRAAPSAPGSAPLQDGPIFRSTSRTMALGVLAAVFSALVAFNLAFLRHLRRVYAPRKGPRRTRSG